MQQLFPILIVTKLSIQTFSPIQTLSEISKNHGNFILTDGLITNFRPIFIPNIFNMNLLTAIGHRNVVLMNI
jgi:hypothetical protein